MLHGSRPIILDGALGTELERRGFNARLPLWSAWALIEAPDLVRRIHSDYVRAGADVLTAATFRTTRYTLAKEALAERAEELTALAIRLAREAAGESVRVAGGMAPLEDCYHPERAPSDDILEREHALAARQLERVGADLILVETQNSDREVRIAAGAALATGLPVWVSLMPRSETELLSGEPLMETAEAVYEMGVEAVLVNCAPPRVIAAAFCRLKREMPEAMLGAYPNFAGEVGVPWEFEVRLSPKGFAEWARPLAREAAILGGCCGTTPEHIAALKKMISENQ